MKLLVALWLACVVCALGELVIFDPASFSDNLFSNPANFNTSRLPVDGDDVIVRITLCSLAQAAGCIIDQDTPLLRSFTIDSNPYQATSCPSTVVVQAGRVLSATTVTVGEVSKLALNASRIACAQFIMGPNSALAGTGTVAATQSVTFSGTSSLLPGWYALASCDRCWPPWNDGRSQYGDIAFDTPLATAALGTTFYIKNLLASVEMPGRLRPGLNYDTIAFTGKLVTYKINVFFIQANNTGPTPTFISPPLQRVMDGFVSWGEIDMRAPFAMTWVLTTYYIFDCSRGFFGHFDDNYPCTWVRQGFSCLATNPDCAWGCTTFGSASALSITVSTGSGCPAQVVPAAVVVTSGSTTSGGGGTAGTTEATSEPRSLGVLLAAIIAPTVVALGVAAGLLIFLLHRRSVRQHGTEWRSKMKESALQDARSRYLANVTPERTPEHSSVDMDN